MHPEESENGVEDGIEETPTDDVLAESDFDSDLDDASVSIGLDKTGEKGSGYHTSNDPRAPYQRQTVTERRGIIEVQCKSRDVIHGMLSGNGEELGTLLVYDFYLDTAKRSRRVVSATLEFEFASASSGSPAPQVHAISPAGRVTLLPTTQDESIVSGTEANANLAQLGALGGVGGKFTWERKVSRTTNDDARVSGRIFSDKYGNGVGASWTLQENPSIKSGTPSFMRCAILLNRGFDDSEFQCRVTIKVDADWKSQIEKLFGSTPKDDPIRFDPELPPTNRLQEYNVDDLSSADLDDISDIVFGKVLKKKAGN